MQPIYPFVVRVRVTAKWKQKVKQPDGSVNEHNGVDFGTYDLRKSGKKSDRANFAMLDGEITNVSDLGKLGWAYKVYYPEIDETYYGVHLEEITVKTGQKVKAGQILAYTGKAKKQTIAEHTHIQSRKGKETGGVYKITIDGKSINPEGLLAKSKLKSEIPQPPKETIDSLKAEIASKSNQIKELVDLLKDRDVALNYANSENAKYREELAKRESELHGVRSSLSDKVAELGKKGGELADLNKKYKNTLALVEELKGTIRVKQNFIDGMYSTFDLLRMLIARIFGKG